MIHEESLRQLERLVAIFRGEKGAWPQTAFEVSSWAHSLGCELNWSFFHTVHFIPESMGCLTVEYILSPCRDGWAQSGALELTALVKREEFLWKTRRVWGPMRRVEVLSFCERPQPYREAV
jgi:hypothetical protein